MERQILRNIFPFVILSIILTGCYRMRAHSGGGQISDIPSRSVNTNDIALLPGYKIEPVIQGLTFPTAIAFDQARL